MLGRILVIAHREFVAAVFNKAFIIGVFLMPVMIGLSLWIPALADRLKSDKVRIVAIIDRTMGNGTGARKAMEALRDLVRQTESKDPIGRLEFEDADAGPGENDLLEKKFELAERVRSGNLAAFFEISSKGEGAKKSTGLTYYSGAAFDKDILTSVAARLAAVARPSQRSRVMRRPPACGVPAVSLR